MNDQKTTVVDRIQHAWNAFLYRDSVIDHGPSSSNRPDHNRLTMGNERSTINAIYNRIAIDVAAILIQHVKLDEEGQFLEVIEGNLNNCLTTEANIDQTGRALIQDIAMSLCDEGSVAVVPVDTTTNPTDSDAYQILTMRTAKILEWKPLAIRVRMYNDKSGRKEEITVLKRMTAIIENPLYAVMNEPNSTLRRLIYKINQLDSIDEQSSSGKLDMIIQVPYSIQSDTRRKQAEDRRKELEVQMAGSKYGIGYIGGTEKITQLNRPVENNLQIQVEYLTSMLYSQLGMSTSILDGTAKEEELLNYFNRTIEPMVSAITDEFKRKFLSKTARSQAQSIMSFRNPFKLVPVSQIAEIADKLSRNEVLSSNELRAVIGYKPSSDPKAKELRNKNINEPTSSVPLEIKKGNSDAPTSKTSKSLEN